MEREENVRTASQVEVEAEKRSLTPPMPSLIWVESDARINKKKQVGPCSEAGTGLAISGLGRTMQSGCSHM